MRREPLSNTFVHAAFLLDTIVSFSRNHEVVHLRHLSERYNYPAGGPNGKEVSTGPPGILRVESAGMSGPVILSCPNHIDSG